MRLPLTQKSSWRASEDAMQHPFIKKLETYRPLTDEERELLWRIPSSERHVAAGSDIATEGSSPTYSILVIEGFAMRYSLLSDGTRQITSLQVPGDFCDIHSFLLRRMDHNVAALSDCLVAQIPHETLMEILQTQPGLTQLLWISTVVDAAVHRQWCVRLARYRATASIAHVLCELFVRMKMIGRTTSNGFSAPLNQTHLSDLTGLGRSHVNLSVQELRRANLINWANQRIEILDWDRLCSLAEFDAAYLNITPEQSRLMAPL